MKPRAIVKGGYLWVALTDLGPDVLLREGTNDIKPVRRKWISNNVPKDCLAYLTFRPEDPTLPGRRDRLCVRSDAAHIISAYVKAKRAGLDFRQKWSSLPDSDCGVAA